MNKWLFHTVDSKRKMYAFQGQAKNFIVSFPNIEISRLLSRQRFSILGSTREKLKKILNPNKRLPDSPDQQISRDSSSFSIEGIRENVRLCKENTKLHFQYPVLRRMQAHYSRMLSLCNPTLMEPKGKVAIITGGAKGIGLCMAEELLCLGAKVVLMDKDQEAAACTVKKLYSLYGRDNLIFVKGDVASYESFEHCFKHTFCSYHRVDILVNNAGILNPSKWKDTIKINFNGVINGIHLGLKYMGANYGKQGGIIINIASIVGHVPLGGAPVYSATKHGIIALTQGYADGFYFNSSCVRICAICPGLTDTSMIEVQNLDMDTKQRELLASQLSRFPSQPPQRLGPAISYIIQYGVNGSIWISENSEFYQVMLPKYQDIECSGTRICKIGS